MTKLNNNSEMQSQYFKKYTLYWLLVLKVDTVYIADLCKNDIILKWLGIGHRLSKGNMYNIHLAIIQRNVIMKLIVLDNLVHPGGI